MAQNKGYMAKIGLDTSDVDKSIRELSKELKTIDRSLKDNGDSAELNAQKYTVLSKEIEATRKKLEQLQKQEATAAEALKNEQISDAEYRAYRREVENTTKALKDLETQLEDLNKPLDDVSDDLDDAADSTKGWLDIMKGDLASAAIQKMGDLLVQLGKKTVEFVQDSAAAYGRYEQLVGGIQTLFSGAEDIVAENAKNAYKTAQISANDYMQQITSFAASMVNSLGGDTRKAAEYADMALRDMSDNAMKMGTDISSIQTAYQSMARQQYQLLDNLRLGYGGTKKEAERLIADANRIKEANGEAADLTLDKFSDLVEAIHLIQTEMVMAGQAANEAAGTIEGSAASAKAAWENLLTGIADPTSDLSTLIDEFVEAKKTEIENLLPAVEHTVEGISSAIDKLVGDLSSNSDVIDAFARKLEDGIPDVINTISDNIGKAAPAIIDGAFTIAESLIKGIGNSMPELIPQTVEIVGNIAQTMLSHLSAIIDAGSELGQGVLDGIIKAVPKLVIVAAKLVGELIGQLAKTLENKDEQEDIEGIGENILTYIIKGLQDSIRETDWKAVTEEIAESWLELDLDNIGFEDIGVKILDHVISGLTSNPAGDAVFYLGNKIMDDLYDGMDSHHGGAGAGGNKGEKIADKINDTKKNVSATYEDFLRTTADTREQIADDFAATLEDVETQWDILYHYDKQSRDEYWENRRKYLETHKNNSEAWWKAWNETEKHFSDAAEKQRQQEEKDRREREQAEEKAERDRLNRQKTDLQKAYDDFEIEYYEHKDEYGDDWLLKKQKEYLDTLDESSDLYREYYKRWLKDKNSVDEKQQKAEDDAAKKRKKELQDRIDKETKEREALINEGKKAAEKLVAEYESGRQDIMNAIDRPQKMTDASGKERLIFSDYKEKLKDLKAYQKNLDKLGSLGLSASHLKEIFAMDFDTRAKYISELINMGDANRKRYLNDYEAYTRAAGNISAKEMEINGFDISDMQAEAMDEAKDNAYIKGKEAGAAYASGFGEGLSGTDLAQFNIAPYTGGITADQAKLYGLAAPVVTKSRAAAEASIKGDLTINVAGTQVMKTGFEKILRAMKNSGGVLDI